MKLFIYSLFICSLLLVFLLVNINSKEELLPFCIIFNLINASIIISKTDKSFTTHNLSRTFNILINLSTLMFMYPDLLASDPYIENYGEEYYIIKAFKLLLIHQSIITIILKLFEFKNIGNINLNEINFYNRNFLKIILNINVSGIILYLFLGNNINNFFSGRSLKLTGSFFRIQEYTGGYNALFHVLNFFVQYLAILGLVYLLNILLKKLTSYDFQIKGDKISILDKYLLLLFTIAFLISAYFSDVRINLIIVIIPTAFLFFYLGKYESRSNLLNRVNTRNSSKILLVTLITISFLLISEIQVYRRTNMNFFEKNSYSFSKNTGVVQTDKSLYNLSQIIKLSPKGGTDEGKEIIYNLPYNFVPSLIAPNKPTRLSDEIQTDTANTIFYNFNDVRTHRSISITYLGEFILAFGEKKGFIFSILSMITISFFNIYILSKISKSVLFPYIYITLISFTFLLCRSINHYSTQVSLLIYSTLILYFFIFLKNTLNNKNL